MPWPVRTYRHVLLAMGLVSVINGILYPVLALYVYGTSEDFFLVGLITALPFLAAVPMSFVWGMVSDRIGSRRLVMASAGTVGGLVFFAMPFAEPLGLVVLRLVQVSFTTSFVLLNAVATECFPKRKGTAVGDLALVGGLGQAVGALLAGTLITTADMRVGSGAVVNLFWLGGALMVAASLSLLPMRHRPGKSEITSLRGLLSFGDRRGMAVVSTVAFLLPLAGYIVFSVFPIYLKGLAIPLDPALTAGIFTALSAVTGIFASGLAGRACDRHGRRPVLIASGIAYILVWGAMGMTVQPVLVAALWAVPVWSFFVVSSITMVSDMTEEGERGRGIGLVNSAINLGGAAGSILAGYLLSGGLVDNIFFLAAAVALMGLLASLAAKETLKSRSRT